LLLRLLYGGKREEGVGKGRRRRRKEEIQATFFSYTVFPGF
jgi:hypothetical protein